jgi:hypothetical protein
VDEAHQRCHQLLGTHWEKMVLLSNTLLDVETINRTEFEALMRGENPFPPSTRRPGSSKPTQREVKGEEGVRDKRADSGLDLGGTLPAPA